MLLKDPDDIPQDLAVEVQVKDIPHARGPREMGKGLGATLFRPRKDCNVDLRVVLRLTD